MRLGKNINTGIVTENFAYADRIILKDEGVVVEQQFFKKCKAKDFKRKEVRK